MTNLTIEIGHTNYNVKSRNKDYDILNMDENLKQVHRSLFFGFEIVILPMMFGIYFVLIFDQGGPFRLHFHILLT